MIILIITQSAYSHVTADQQRRLDRAYKRMHQSGAHYVVDGISDVPPLLDAINARLARGERP